MFKFLYFGKWYASGLSLDEILRKHDNYEEIWAYSINESGNVAMCPSILSADKITNITIMK